MIGSLHGIVELVNKVYILVNVHGVGYKIYVPQKLIASSHIGDKVNFFTYTHIREDILDLYGLPTQEELKLFEACIMVSGIGPKTALNIFSIGTREQIIHAIQNADVNFFISVPRLGKKNAQKLIIELKGKIEDIAELNVSKEDDEIIAALKSFGFTQKEAENATKAVGKDDDISKRLKMALKYLGK
jgi:Holliday junction DNA helicase RuvA